MMEILNTSDSLGTGRSFLIRAIQDGAELVLSLPGCAREHVKVRCTDSELRISISEEADRTLLSKTSFRYAHSIKNPKISAKMRDGMLRVTLLSALQGTEIPVELP